MAERWARTIAECAPRSVQATKQAAMEGRDSRFARQCSRTTPRSIACGRAPTPSRARAFAEKRAPRWK